MNSFHFSIDIVPCAMSPIAASEKKDLLTSPGTVEYQPLWLLPMLHNPGLHHPTSVSGSATVLHTVC